MNERLLRLARQVREELPELDRLVQRAQEGWARAQETSDELYLDSVALSLHGLYAGVERLFERIAASVDASMPQGENWHQMLLQQLADERPGVRPAVISEQARDALDEYRGFRHVVRHVYPFRFDPVRLEGLVKQLPARWARVRAELLAFAAFLERRA